MYLMFRTLLIGSLILGNISPAFAFQCDMGPEDLPPIPHDPRISHGALRASYKYDFSKDDAYSTDEELNLSGSPIWESVLGRLQDDVDSQRSKLSGSPPPGLSRDVLSEVFQLSPEEKSSNRERFEKVISEKWQTGFDSYIDSLSDSELNKFFEKVKNDRYTQWQRAKAAGLNVPEPYQALPDHEVPNFVTLELEKAYNRKISDQAYALAKPRVEEFSRFASKSWSDWVRSANSSGIPSDLSRKDFASNDNSHGSRSFALGDSIDLAWKQSIGLVENERQKSIKNLGESSDSSHGGSRSPAGNIPHDSAISEKDFVFDTDAPLTDDIKIHILNRILNPDKDNPQKSMDELKATWNDSFEKALNGKGVSFFHLSPDIYPDDPLGNKFQKDFSTFLSLEKTYEDQLKTAQEPRKSELLAKLTEVKAELEKMRNQLRLSLRTKLAQNMIFELRVRKNGLQFHLSKDLNEKARAHAEKKVRSENGLNTHDNIPDEYKEAFDQSVNYESALYKREHMDATNPVWDLDLDYDGESDIQGSDADPYSGHKGAYKKYDAYTLLSSKQSLYLERCLQKQWKQALASPPPNLDKSSYDNFLLRLQTSNTPCIDKLFPPELKRLRKEALETADEIYRNFMVEQTAAVHQAMAFGVPLKAHEQGMDYIVRYSAKEQSTANGSSGDPLAALNALRAHQREGGKWLKSKYNISVSSDGKRSLDFSKFDISKAEELLNDDQARETLMQSLGPQALPSLELLNKLKIYAETEGAKRSDGLGPQVIGDTVFWVGSDFTEYRNQYGTLRHKHDLKVFQMPLEEYRQKACKDGKAAYDEMIKTITDYGEASAAIKAGGWMPYKNFFVIGTRGLTDMTRDLFGAQPIKGAPTKELRKLDTTRDAVLEASKKMSRYNLRYGLGSETPLTGALRDSFRQTEHFDPQNMTQAGFDEVFKGIKANSEYLIQSGKSTGGKLIAAVAAYPIAAGAGAVSAVGLRAAASGVSAVRGASIAARLGTIATTRAGFGQASGAFGRTLFNAAGRTAFTQGARTGTVMFGFANAINPLGVSIRTKFQHDSVLDQGGESDYWATWRDEYATSFEGMNNPKSAMMMGVMGTGFASIGHYYKFGASTPWRIMQPLSKGRTFSQILKESPNTANMIANLQASAASTAIMAGPEAYGAYQSYKTGHEEIEKIQHQIDNTSDPQKKKELQDYRIKMKAQLDAQLKSIGTDFLTYDVVMAAAFVRMPAEFFNDVTVNKKTFRTGVEASIARNAREIGFGSKNTEQLTMTPDGYHQYQAEMAKLRSLRDPNADIADYEPIKLRGKDGDGNFVFEVSPEANWESLAIRNQSVGRTLFPPSWTPSYMNIDSLNLIRPE